MIFFDLFVWVNILRFVRNKHLLHYLCVNTDFRQIVNDELSSRKDHKDVWFQKQRLLHQHYEKFNKKGGVVSKFQVGSCGLIFVIFHYFDKPSGKQIYNFVVISENHQFLLKEFQLLKKQKKPLHFEFKYYPFLQELLITSNYSDNVDLPSMLINLTTMRYDLQTDEPGWKSAEESSRLGNGEEKLDYECNLYSVNDFGNVKKLFNVFCDGYQYPISLQKTNFNVNLLYHYILSIHVILYLTINRIFHFSDLRDHWLIEFRKYSPTYELNWNFGKFVYALVTVENLSILSESTNNLEPVYEKSTKRFYFYHVNHVNHINTYDWQLNKIYQL
jgi:hypothetical protein